ncbi:CACNA1B [Symbiodinium natans]|uniref:CACNA1B protein n=1 Tax=Symbiodinium natans TaxID=878477 RepID=A0A812UGN1_9DINO|nr:CACNA1B [Symbiodinium natans]
MAHTSSAGLEVSKMNSMGTKSKSTMVERIEYDPYEMPGPYDDDDVHRTHSGRRRSSVNAMPTVSAQFIKRDLHGSFLDGRTVMQSYIYMFLKSPWTTNSLAAITMFDAYLSCVDIDRGAASLPPIAWVSVTTQLCLVLYTVEWLSWLFVRGRRIVKDLMLMMELLIILCGYGELILALTVESVADSIVAFRMLRIARTLRLLKLFRRVGYFKELRKVLTMATTCLRTLLWSFLFCFVVMTFWSMLLVDLVQPLIVDLHESSSTFADCEECVRMSSSVMMANLLLFKTVIAGDSWGLIAVPVIEAHPATAIIFVGSLLTLVFGVLNLIVAVVVDTFAETRQRDVLGMAEELETDFEEDRRLLQRIFDRVDTQGSGQLSLEDLFTAAQEDPELQSRLRVMDIDEADLQQLFEMIDVDGSGTVEKSEFIEPLSRWVHA